MKRLFAAMKILALVALAIKNVALIIEEFIRLIRFFVDQ